ncbi:MAG TPA: 5-dehydro-2-deoxygluconokinase [Candidatus Dormibacteraeota bacterium]|nr:5-dehydro-2-deoxygluconokinase [Candidatus Dormibacteraeota bacterium]
MSLRSWTAAGGVDVVVMGRLSADLYPAQIRTPLREQRNFVRYVGGFAGNVCTGLARLQVRTAIVSKVGNDGHGEFIRDFLAREGVEVGWLRIDHTLNTPIVFCEIWPPDRFPLLFYRTPTCPDWELTTDDFDVEAVADAPIMLASGTGLAREKSRSAHMAALERHRGTAIFDLDYRPSFWSGAGAYKTAVQAVLPRADIVVGNEDEVRAATGVEDPRQGIVALRAFGPNILILKRGGEGAALFEGDRTVEVPPVRMTVVNGLGAGDAFLATVTHGLLRGIDLLTAVRRANWSGAYVASQIPCSEAMPYLKDVDASVP